MITHNLYKHKNNTDVALYPARIFHRPSDSYYINCRWINIVNPNNIYDTGITDHVVIKEIDINNWILFKELK